MGLLAAAVALVVFGSILAIPAVILLGLVLGIAELVRLPWMWRGTVGLEYRRHLPRRRAVVGDELPLDLTVWNRKALPLGWLRADDEASAGVDVRERPLVDSDAGTEVLRNAWTLAPWEKVTRHLHIRAERRGVFSLGPARLEVGDLLARHAATTTLPGRDAWLVRPRMVSVAAAEATNPWGGELRARRGLVEDRTRYAGVRPYQPGDAVRSIHWRATARLGSTVVRRYEPGRHHELLLALDLDTGGVFRAAAPPSDEAVVEELCIAAASIVRRLRDDGAAVGLAAAAWSGSRRALAFVAPSASHAQLGRCLDVLAQLTPHPSAPFERLVTTVVRQVRPGTRIVVLTARDTSPYLASLRRAAQAGFPVEVVTLGAAGAAGTRRARAAGLEARSAALDGPWQTARTLVVGA